MSLNNRLTTEHIQHTSLSPFNMNSKVGVLATQMANAPLKSSRLDKLKSIDNDKFVEEWKRKANDSK